AIAGILLTLLLNAVVPFMFATLGGYGLGLPGVAIAVFTSPIVWPAMLGRAIGVFLVALGIRLSANIYHLPDGFRALPRNFRRLMLCTSPMQRPELLPGSVPREFEFQQVFARGSFGFSMTAVPRLIDFVVWFVPAWFYRFSIK